MINVTRTYLPDVNKYKNYVDKIFESGWVTNNGQFVRELQERLKEHLGVRNLLLVSNGTLALQVAYKLLDLHGEVITTPFSFVATTSSLVWEGLKPVFADINRDDYCIDCNQIEKKITDKTSAILPVHVFGNVCDVENITALAKRYNLKVIYDAAHAFDVKYKGQSVLNYGDVSVLSFHATKLFHTIEGGAIIINDDELFKKAKLLINFGITGPDAIVQLGINCKMNEFQAAMGLCVLEDIPQILLNRERVNKYYMNNLDKRLKFQLFSPNTKRNYSYFPVLFESEIQLLKVKELLNDNEIFPRRYFYPSLDTLCYLENDSEMKISRGISSRILCLPVFEFIDENDLELIVKIVNEGIGQEV